MSATNISAQSARAAVKSSARVVIKIGSALLADLKNGLNRERIESVASQLSALQKRGVAVILVSSGAVAAGSAKLGFKKRPDEVRLLQAAAAVGQGKLMRYYSEAFGKHDIPVGQMLLTRDGIDERLRYLNARNTLCALLELGCVPIINENDTVMVEEIQFGDNDCLSGLVASMAEADLLVILSDVDGLHEKPPALGESPLIPYVPKITAEVEALAGISQSGVSKGGMASKLSAAKYATANGVNVIIASGKDERVIEKILAGEEIGTLFPAVEHSRSAKKQWLAGRSPTGRIFVDDGAKRAVLEHGRSLLPIGMTGADDGIAVGDTVSIVDSSGKEFARGICNFESADLKRIFRRQTNELQTVLGHRAADTVVHRDNLALVSLLHEAL